MADPRPWLALECHKSDTLLVEDELAFPVASYTKAQQPTLVALIGHTAKVAAMDRLLNRPKPLPSGSSAGKIDFQVDPATRRQPNPMVFMDCGLHNHPTQSTPVANSFEWATLHNVLWADTPAYQHSRKRYRIALSLYSRVLCPLTSCLCIFSADFNGVEGTLTLLFNLAKWEPIFDSAPAPRVLVIFSDVHSNFDAQSKKSELRFALYKLGVRYFGELDVVGLPVKKTHAGWNERLRSSIARLVEGDEAERRRRCLRFGSEHLHAFLKEGLRGYVECIDWSTSFLKVARSTFPPSHHLSQHISQAMQTIPRETIEELVPWLASALVLDSLPPGMHAFSASVVFKDVYEEPCWSALSGHFEDSALALYLRSRIRTEFESRYGRVSTRTISAANAHRMTLQALQCTMRQIFTTLTCLCCVMREPEKVLGCGHALCNTCVRIFGWTCEECPGVWTFQECVVCGLENDRPGIRLKPLTAGTRILSIDGGGTRGVIPLAFLDKIEEVLAPLDCQLWEFFDFVGGTSAGALIALGIFLMRWSPRECIEKFESLALDVFRRRSRNGALFFRVRDLITSYLSDCKYDSRLVEGTLELAFGDVRLFNPAGDDVKVAITAAAVHSGKSCIFTNYRNGVTRDLSPTRGYCLVGSRMAEKGLLLRDVARCATAAPWFFQPKLLEEAYPADNTFQDGALTHNNPLRLCLQEASRIWPEHTRPDFALSLGTGKPGRAHGPYTQRVRRAIPRLLTAFMSSLDGDKAWEDIRNSLDDVSKQKFHRIDMELPEGKLAIDDVGVMAELKAQATRYMSVGAGAHLRVTFDLIFSSLFYIELERVPSVINRHLYCEAVVLCRLPSKSLYTLYDMLWEKDAHFVVNGKPTRCVERLPRSTTLRPFQKRLTFTMDSYSDIVSVSLQNVTYRPRSIGGLPRTLQQLMRAQSLVAPFGRSDHAPPGGSIPPPPTGLKRKRSQ